MKRFLIAASALLILASALLADTVVLKNGKRLSGKILSESADSLLIEVDGQEGRIRTKSEQIVIARAVIASIRYEDLSKVSDELTLPRDPDYNSLMFCPTPSTIPKGDFYFRDFELYILNFGWGIRETTSLSFMTHFPVVSFMDFGAIGFKQRFLDRERHDIGLALAGSYTFFTEDIEDDSFLTGSVILGWGDRERSLNLALNQSYRKNEDPFTTIVVGMDFRVSRRMKFLVEYANATEFLDEDFNGFLNLGLRFFGNDWSFSLTGLRPLESTGSLMFVPMIQFSYHAD